MITARDMSYLIGMQGTIHLGGLTIAVRLIDVKTSYGKVRYHVTPLSGNGSIWVESIALPVERGNA